MRTVLILPLFTFFLIPVNGQMMYSKVNATDIGIYIYFSKFLDIADECLKNFLDENPNTNISKSFKNKMELIEEEYKFYKARGVESNVSIVLGPFLSLANGINKLITSQHTFLNNNDTNIRRLALINMWIAIDEISKALNEIEKIELWKDIHFDVSNLKSRLAEVYDLLRYYDNALKKLEKTILIVTISNENPVLYENVTIHVYAKNVTPLYLFIDNLRFNATTLNYSFDRIGEHIIYAVGICEGKIVKSNILKVYVRKIPTYIVLSAKSVSFLNESVKVEGWLFDYYGNPIEGNITVLVEDKVFLNTYAHHFKFNVTRQTEGYLNITVYYPGNNSYEGCIANHSIYFTKFYVTLYIKANKTSATLNESIRFEGFINLNYTVPLYVFVNDTSVMKLEALRKFNFTLTFIKPGEYEVYVYFPGDKWHKATKSNIVRIEVKELFMPVLFLVSITTPFILYGIYGLYIRRKKEKKVYKERKEVEKIAVEEKIKIDLTIDKIEYAYRYLFNTLVNKYNLKRSLTPRELLKALKNEPFATKLEVVTTLHEKMMYGGKRLSDVEERLYLNYVNDIIKTIEKQFMQTQ